MQPRGWRRAVLAGLVLVGASYVGWDHHRSHSPPDYHGGAPAAPVALPHVCPTLPQDVPFPPDGTLPRGAVGVRLCGDVGGPALGAYPEQLRSHVDRIVDVVDSVPDVHLPGCGPVGGPTFVFWFTYPDGGAYAVEWTVGDCADLIRSPSVAREGGYRVMDAFVHALDSQRRAEPTPPPRPPPSCRASTSPMVETFPVDLASAQVCVDGFLGHQHAIRSATLSPAQLRILMGGTGSSSVDQGASACADRRNLTLVGYTERGDLVSLPSQCRTFRLFGLSSYQHEVPDQDWTPAPEAQRMLRRLSFGPPVPLADLD